MRRYLVALCLIGWSVFFAATPVFAQEGGLSPADTPTGWVFRWINFAIVFGLIIWGFSKATPYFRRHAQEISEKIAEGTRAREAAEAKSREAQAKMADLDKEVKAMREEARRDSAAEILRLRAKTKEEAERVEQEVRVEIAAAERAARLELKTIAARMAVERAEALLQERMTPQAESELFRVYVAELDRSLQPGEAGVN